jgi:amino acid transporter
MGLWQATAIGVGGMIGAGIFSVMGVAGRVAGPAAGVAFALAGLLALICGFSFGRLGARYPSAGGPVEYLTRGLGDGVVSGSLNLMLWAGYVLALAMYARAFGSYGASLLPETWAGPAVPVLAVAVAGAFLALNVAGADAVGRAELFVVSVKVVILLGFLVAVAPGIEPSRIAPSAWPGPGAILSAAAIVFLSYEGFGLITNAAEDMQEPERTLPRAIHASIAFTLVVYVAVAFTVLGTLSVEELNEASEYALARAAEPRLGRAGFTLMAVAALFSTASAINATLYGGANVSTRLAEKGGLPSVFRERVWMGSTGSLFVTGGLVALIAATAEVERIAMAGSAAFLLVYGAIHAAHLRLDHETGAPRSALIVALLGCAAVLTALVRHLLAHEPTALAGFAGLALGCFLFEWGLRARQKARRLEQRGD